MIPNLKKNKRVTDRRYLQWVKTNSCLLFKPGWYLNECLGEIDPHHVKPVSLGGSDYTAVPLCRRHHNEAQKSRAGFETKYAILFDYEIDRLNKLYFLEHPLPKRERKSKPMKARLHVTNCEACGREHDLPYPSKVPFDQEVSVDGHIRRLFMCVNKNQWVSVQ